MPDQVRHFEFKADDSTAALNNRQIGILGAGVYCGFQFKDITDLNITLQGDQSEVGVDGVEMTNGSILLTRQGVTIKESRDIVITLPTNTAGGNRIDTLYCRHVFIVQEGGQNATYGLVSTTAEATVPAPVPDPLTDTLIGHVFVPAGWAGGASAELTYTRVNSPSLASDPTHARTFLKNVFTQMQTLQGIAYLPKHGFGYDGTLRVHPGDEGASLLQIDEFFTGGNPTPVEAMYDIVDVSIGTSTGRRVYVIPRRDVQFMTTGNVKTPYNRDWIVKAHTVAELLDISDLAISGKDWILQPSGLAVNAGGDLLIPGSVVIEQNLDVLGTANQHGKPLATQEWCYATFRVL